jgi:hypothetical protein
MLELPTVTLCCIDTVNPPLALRALRLSGAEIRFASTLLLADRPLDAAGVEVRVIEPFASRVEYSEFVLKSLVRHIDTPFVLLIQWDGYVINPAAWRGEFLACDYIGAKWFWHQDAMRVGNGGFSLRSRKLLAALQDPRIALDGNEDETIGRKYRPLLEREQGIVFASEALADAFAFEAAYPVGKPFGFHGLYNFCRVVPPAELTSSRAFTPAIARSPQLLQLGRNCHGAGPVANGGGDLRTHPRRSAGSRGGSGSPGEGFHRFGGNAHGRPQRSLPLRQRQALQALSRSVGHDRSVPHRPGTRCAQRRAAAAPCGDAPSARRRRGRAAHLWRSPRAGTGQCHRAALPRRDPLSARRACRSPAVARARGRAAA